MSALGNVVRAGVGRRRLQTFVLGLTALLAVTASIMATCLLVGAQAPFDDAFAAARGAHVVATFDGHKASAAQAAQAAHAEGVTGSAGPFPTVTLRSQVGSSTAGFLPAGSPLPAMTIVGRSTPGGPVDDLHLVSGRWATAPGEVVVTSINTPVTVGDSIAFPNLPGDPQLTVVGTVTSTSSSADAWVTPAELQTLAPQPDWQMLLRFAHASSNADVVADRTAISSVTPQGSMTGASSWLQLKKQSDRESATYVPFIVAFSVLGLCISVLTVGVIVSGSVGAAKRRIGVLKALGFTPSQVVRAYVAQAVIPAVVGSVLGIGLGYLGAEAAMGKTAVMYGAAAPKPQTWVLVTVPLLILLVIAGTAFVPALRAGRMSTTEALTVGRTPKAGRARGVQRFLSRSRLPRFMSLGLAQPFSRPARTATTAAAVVLGTVGVTFGVGLALSLNNIQQGLNQHTPGTITVQPSFGDRPGGPGGTMTPMDYASVDAAIAHQAGTRRYFSTESGTFSVAGQAGQTQVVAYRGDSSWGSFQLVSGRWFHGAGEAVVPSGFLDETGTKVGDTVTLVDNQDHTARVKIVGEALSLEQEGMVVLTDAQSLPGMDDALEPMTTQFDIDTTPGTSVTSYRSALDSAVQPYHGMALTNDKGISGTVIAMDTLAGMLTLMLVTVAGLGVLNTVLLDTRERVHDIGVFKAVGMSPRQTLGMVLTSVAGIGVVAAAIGVPLGMWVHDVVLPQMGSAAGTRIPASDLAVYSVPVTAGLAAGGLLVAMLGALLPAGWAARTRTATALRTE